MKPLYLNKQIKQLEEWTAERIGISPLLLMEHAGIKVVEHIETLYPGKPVALICGPGNNGGDGFVIARILFLMGRDVLTLVLPHESSLKGEAGVNFKILKNLEAPIIYLNPSQPLESEWIKNRVLVDCIFGTGFSRPLTGTYKLVVECMNTSGRPIVSVDIPSGINGDTGEAMGDSVSAESTVALGTYKLGHFQKDGFTKRGSLVLSDIGIPEKAHEGFETYAWFFEDSDVEMILKKKNRAGHKYNSGKVLFLSGSRDMTGAALFNAMGALRSGAGLVKMMVEEPVWSAIAGKVPEAVAFTFPEQVAKRGDLTENMLSEMENFDILVAGSGCGKTPLLKDYIVKAVGMENKIIILDADALNVLSAEVNLIDKRGAGSKVIITPHLGEFEKLTGAGKSDDLVESAKAFSKEHEVYTVLKGPVTIVAEPGGEAFICAGGHRAMATAGSGDVLTGVVAGVLAQVPKIAAGVLEAVDIHQKAGCLAAEKIHERSVLASDIADSLSEALSKIEKQI
ncbi:MAG TPA: NAD(P)H-hydrate dehydratase [Clostridia bacterium]|nr:NAD(P)H-hydrate dehydratase [Clostridia bacterium]